MLGIEPRSSEGTASGTEPPPQSLETLLTFYGHEFQRTIPKPEPGMVGKIHLLRRTHSGVKDRGATWLALKRARQEAGKMRKSEQTGNWKSRRKANLSLCG